MSCVFMDGYESGTTLLTGTAVSIGALPGTGRDGVGLACRASVTGSISHVFVSGSDTIYFHTATVFAAACFGDTATESILFAIQSDVGTLAHITINVDSTGHLTLRRGGSTGTIVATSTLTVSAAAWRSIQVKATIHDTTGECIVKVDGVTYINFTGDTRNGGISTRPDRIVMGAGSGGIDYRDDFLLNDTTGSVNNSWTGDVCIVGIRPAGNGANSGLIGSDSDSINNYQNVDEVTFSAADYNGSVTTGAKDTYDMGALGKTGSVLAVQALAHAIKSDAGAKSFKHVLRSATPTTISSGAVALSTTVALYQDAIRETDADATAWSVSKVDSAEFGFEVV